MNLMKIDLVFAGGAKYQVSNSKSNLNIHDAKSVVYIIVPLKNEDLHV